MTKKFAIIFGEIIFGIIILSSNIICPFKLMFNIDCPFCGLTRSMKSLYHFDILSSLKYNCFGIFLFLLLAFYNIVLMTDIIYKKDNIKIVHTKIKRNCFAIILLLCMCYVINLLT